jgi:hypothetical protein
MDEEYHCGDMVCIPSERVCDAIEDCQDKSDEANCKKLSLTYWCFIFLSNLFLIRNT